MQMSYTMALKCGVFLALSMSMFALFTDFYFNMELIIGILELM